MSISLIWIKSLKSRGKPLYRICLFSFKPRRLRAELCRDLWATNLHVISSFIGRLGLFILLSTCVPYEWVIRATHCDEEIRDDWFTAIMLRRGVYVHRNEGFLWISKYRRVSLAKARLFFLSVDRERYLGETGPRPLHFKWRFYPGATWVSSRVDSSRRKSIPLMAWRTISTDTADHTFVQVAILWGSFLPVVAAIATLFIDDCLGILNRNTHLHDVSYHFVIIKIDRQSLSVERWRKDKEQ